MPGDVLEVASAQRLWHGIGGQAGDRLSVGVFQARGLGPCEGSQVHRAKCGDPAGRCRVERFQRFLGRRLIDRSFGGRRFVRCPVCSRVPGPSRASRGGGRRGGEPLRTGDRVGARQRTMLGPLRCRPLERWRIRAQGSGKALGPRRHHWLPGLEGRHRRLGCPPFPRCPSALLLPLRASPSAYPGLHSREVSGEVWDTSYHQAFRQRRQLPTLWVQRAGRQRSNAITRAVLGTDARGCP